MDPNKQPLPSNTITNPNIHSITDRIKSGEIKRIVVLTGAGISTSAGIPDFRSPGTGLYDRLAPLKLPYPEAIFHINYFSHSPELFYGLARARHPGNLKPTISHAFLALLAKKHLLHFLFTQNLDGLEETAGVPADKVLWTHGNWKSQHCSKCNAFYPDHLMKKAIATGDVPYCLVDGCNAPVKPDVVFFGQALPAQYDAKVNFIDEADLLIVMGTSLKVAPCSSLPSAVLRGVPRLLVNLDHAGDMGCRDEDICLLGSCDDGVRNLADILGWREELEAIWREAVARCIPINTEFQDGPSIDECIAKMAAQMDAKLGISKGHKNMLENHLDNKFAQMIGKTSRSPTN